jgi:hypothetical protein
MMKKIKTTEEKLKEEGIISIPVNFNFAKVYQDNIDAKNRAFREAKEKEEARIALIECPSCIIDEYFVCNNCGTMFKDLSKRKNDRT